MSTSESATKLSNEISAGQFTPTGEPLHTSTAPAIVVPEDTEDIYEIPVGYTWGGVIGHGAFGVVAKITNNDSGKAFALKRVREYSTMFGQGQLGYAKKICREVAALQALQGLPNVIPLILTYLSGNKKHVYMMMPYIDFELEYAIKEKFKAGTPFKEEEIKWIAYQLLVGVAASHAKQIMHRDITLKNILMDPEFNVFIADYGLARANQTCHQSITLDVVTLEYRAPELLLQYDKYGYKVDMWSVGCIIAELFLQRRLFEPEPRDIPNGLLFQVLNLGKPDLQWVKENAHPAALYFLENVVFKKVDDEVAAGNDPYPTPVPERLAKAGASKDAIELIMSLLKFDFPQRRSATEALQSKWFTSDDGYKECDGVHAPLSFLAKLQNPAGTAAPQREGYDGSADADGNKELHEIQAATTIENLRALMEKRVTPGIQLYTVKTVTGGN